MSTVKIKKGDTVKVIAGKDKEKEGKVLSVDAKNNKVVVEGVNMVTKHSRDPPYNTSGARETIFMNCFSRSSLATGPKIRVPLGVLSSRIITAAFSSNLM